MTTKITPEDIPSNVQEDANTLYLTPANELERVTTHSSASSYEEVGVHRSTSDSGETVIAIVQASYDPETPAPRKRSVQFVFSDTGKLTLISGSEPETPKQEREAAVAVRAGQLLKTILHHDDEAA